MDNNQSPTAQDFFDARDRRQGRNTNQNTTSGQTQLTPEQFQGISDSISNISRSISALDLENTSRLNIPDRPQRESAQGFINQTVIPAEQAGPSISPEMQNLANQINQRSSILNELGLGEITNTFSQLMDRGDFTSDLEDQAGIGVKTTALNDIQSQLRETDLRFRREREDLEDATGMTRGTKALALNELSSKQARTLADLSIIEATRRDDLATAQALVDRKVQLTFEPLEQQLQFQQFLFDQNKDIFNTLEQRQFQENMMQKEAEMEREMFQFKQLEQTRLDVLNEAARFGATNSQLQAIQQAPNEEGIYSAAGNKIGQLERLSRQLKQMDINSKSLDIEMKNKELAELENPTTTLDIKPDSDAATFAMRIEDAESVLGSGDISGFERAGSNLLNSKIVGFIPGARTLGKAIFGSDAQEFRQAERNFINAVLRRESGAAIADSEFDSAREQYIPQPGDSEATLQQKTRNREVVFKGLRMSSGGAYEVLSTQLTDGAGTGDFVDPEAFLNQTFDSLIPNDQFFNF